MAELSNSISPIPQHIFARYIVEKLRKSNPHIDLCVNESDFVLGGAVVHIPQAGASPTVVKNRSSFPATAVMRSDSQIIYPLDVYSTTPSHITWHEKNEISYDKTDSVLNDHVATLIEVIGDNILYNWVHAYNASDYTAVNLPSTHLLATTGTAVAATESGQTGNRKALHWKDLQSAQAMMNKQNVPTTERYALLESYMYQQLLASLTNDNMMAAFQRTADLNKGVLGELFGFRVMQRSTVVNFAANGTPKLPGEVMAATDNVGALLWQKNSVAKAEGDMKMFQNIDDPQYYGDIASALVKMGGRCRRADWAGIVAIVQGSAT